MSDFKAKMHQIRCRLGLRPRPRWGGGTYSAPPEPLAGMEGADCPGEERRETEIKETEKGKRKKRKRKKRKPNLSKKKGKRKKETYQNLLY